MQRKYKPGDKVYELTLIEMIPYRTHSGRSKPKWRCRCSCGKETIVFASNFGNTVSCGHVLKKRLSETHFENLEGQTFGWLDVLHRAPDRIRKNGRHVVQWCCKCDCGKIVNVDAAELKKGATTSCGCHHSDWQRKKYDLTGKVFNSLKVLYRMPSVVYGDRKTTVSRWMCECLECGCKKVIFGSAVRRGQMTCGCINSRGEYEAAKIFKEKGIEVEKAFSFDDLLSPNGYPLFFDFAAKDSSGNLALIEFQGIQHYIPQPNHFGDYQREVTDPLKKSYCREHNIPLYEIRYDEDLQSAIDEIINKVYANPVPSSKEKV